MAILADTSGIIAMLDRDDRHHIAVVEVIQTDTVLVPTTILPEVDYLATKYLGERVARSFLEAVIRGEFTYLPVESIDLERGLAVMARYQGVPLGVVDASLVALAERLHISKILTLDRRHFSLVQPEGINYLELLPLF
jgi:predicted nucleic acid-binding protein